MPNLILRAAGKDCSSAMFWKLLLGTVVMLLCGYCGETSILPAWPGFTGGLAGWAFILFEIFAGESGGKVSSCVLQQHALDCHNWMEYLPSWLSLRLLAWKRF